MSSGDELRYDGRVAIVTGAGRGLGRAYAIALAARGARVVVNDLGSRLAGEGSDSGPAAEVAAEITRAGGEAVANDDSVSTTEGAEAIVAAAMTHFGGVDIVVNNAGIMDPGGLLELSVTEVARHVDVHAIGAFNVTRAAWPTMMGHGYGRVVLTTSVGMYGGSFLISYATAKGAAVSLGRSLADAGVPHGIRVNLLAPAAETRMVTDPDYRAKCELPPLDESAPPDPTRDPDRVVPMLLALTHERCPVNGEIMWAGLGRFARVFIGETRGIVDPTLSAEGVLERWSEITDETGYAVHPTTAAAVAYREAMISAELAR
ncbi:MAG TPA: SDR family NAD(P)-dependent oxidoreductase [Solirubrobacteraceae bacterium]|nr:SDR family NAD(P)-dependent oxidoreductase [Solirubrobacteraceae bacterium]